MSNGRFYMVCPMARQMLAEATKEDWSGANDKAINAEAPWLKSFTACWKNSAVDIKRVEDLIRKIEAHLGGNAESEVSSRPDVPSFIHYEGYFSDSFGKICRSFRIASGNSRFTVSVDAATKLQKYYFLK